MTRLGAEVENIRETAKWRAKHAEVISTIKGFEEVRENYYENEMLTDPDDEEHEWIVKWINEDFLSFLKEQMYSYPEGGAGVVFIQRAVEEHIYTYDNNDDEVRVGVWKQVE